ncbi:ATP-grasp domain-containing protein [Aeromonas dhakensis]|uniref:ATP-grasp domain-containing protein n=1 Tax=Aeromonas dhakensis TaxID=196024 RepID=UPI002E30211E|nr:ATP-grasp domain-containing protein [Aeromonas dhakensis]MED7773485.1 ATP-grasp domain-containing protein [Aeromonas dhakensis]
MTKVLVFPCGSEIGLEVQRALGKSVHFTLIGGSSCQDHGRYSYPNYIGDMPYVSEPGFIEKLNEIIIYEDIKYIIPAHDAVLTFLSENQEIVHADIVSSISETCILCRSKKATYEYLSSLIKTPRIYIDDIPEQFPIFMKPDVGQGSKGTRIINNPKEMSFFKELEPNALMLEYLPGKEYTVDCFTDRHGSLKVCSARDRARISNGISVNTKLIHRRDFLEIANIINDALKLRGAWFYQVKENATEELVLLEVAPRIAGTSAITSVNGANLIELALYDRMGIDIEIYSNNLDVEVDRSLSSKILINNDFEHIYLDFDETLHIDDSVNHEMIAFIYKMKNKNKKIYLITKHHGDIFAALDNLKICHRLFDDIIHLNDSDNKADYIEHISSIFIDDSFSERNNISKRLGIPSFSVDVVGMLI